MILSSKYFMKNIKVFNRPTLTAILNKNKLSSETRSVLFYFIVMTQ